MKKLDGSANRQNMVLAIWRRFRKNKTAMFGLICFLVILFFALGADFFAGYESATAQNPYIRYHTPDAQNIMGTDAYGRDVFARILHGARLSLVISLTTVAGGMIGGIFLGAVCGYFGGKIDSIIMRINDVLMAIPSTLMAVTVVAALGTSTANLIVALIVSMIPPFSRIVRSTILQVKTSDYVEAAKSYGSGSVYIIMKHVLPNAIGPIIVQGTLNLASTLLSVAALGFIGLGIPAPAPEWGTMLSEAKKDMLTYPYLLIFPAVSIVLTVLSINLIGDGLRDAIDPKLKN